MRVLRVVLIILIIACSGAAVMFGLQAKRIVTVDGEGLWEEAEQVTKELLELKDELAELNGEVQGLETVRLEIENKRFLHISLPGAVTRGENLLYYHEKDRKLYYIDQVAESCRAIYTVKEPWYLLDYDLSESGMAVWAQKWNSEYKQEQEIGIFVQDLLHGGAALEIDRLRPPYWLQDEDDLQMQKLAFSPDGAYIVIQLAGQEWKYFNVYTVNPPGKAIVQTGYDEMTGSYMQKEFVAFVANSSAVLYTEPADFAEYAGQTLLYEESLYYNDQGFFRLKDFAGEAFLSTDGELYVIGEKAGGTGVQLEALPALRGESEQSYLYQVRNQRFLPRMPEPSSAVQTDVDKDWPVVEVRSAEELLKAIGPKRVIRLAAGSYNLTAAGRVDNPYLKYVPVDTQFQVVIRNVDGLKLVPAGDEPAEILAEPTYSNVLGFENCRNITISGIRAGHLFEGYCTGGVLEFSDSSGIWIQNSLFYGSGTYGLTLRNVQNFQLANSVITECTYGIMDVYGSEGLWFLKCRFTQNRDLDMINLREGSQANFEECEFSENWTTWTDGKLFAIEASSKASVRNSKIINNDTRFLTGREERLELIDTVLKGNKFTAKYEE